jgi:phosphoesterase RecJ-like protein
MNIDAALQFLAGAAKILITTHIRPDGDAVGSCAGLKNALENSPDKAEVQILFLSRPPYNYEFLIPVGSMILGTELSEEEVSAGRLDGFDRIVVVDTAASRQLEPIAGYLQQRQEDVLVLDHHLSGDISAGCRVVDTTASAAGEMVYRLVQRAGWELGAEGRKALFAAIGTDTGWFQFSNSSARAFAVASELIEQGVAADVLYQQLFLSEPLEKLRLTALALESLELHCEGQLAVFSITFDMLHRSGADRTHLENIVNEPMRIGSVVATVLLVELDDGGTRCSLRSKRQVDVNEVANQFGGGGHARAAGVTFTDALPQAREKLIKAIHPLLD